MNRLFLNITSGCALALIFLALFVPTSYIAGKAFILVLMCIGIIFNGFTGHLTWSKKTITACFVFACVGLGNSFHGFFNGNQGAVAVLTVMVFWPLVYCAASSLLLNEKSLGGLIKILFLSLGAIIAYTVIYLGHEAGVVPSWAYIKLDMGQDVNDLFVEYSLYNISSLFFLLPFAVTYLYMVPVKKIELRFLTYLGVIICAAIVALSGRRALQIIFFLTPLISLISINILRRSLGFTFRSFIQVVSYWLPKVLLLLFFLFIAANFLIKDFFDVFESNLINSFDFSSGDKEVERVEQFSSLINGWINSGVIWGAGNGGNTEIIRSHEMPWAYELTYVYLLFSTGIFGVVFYLSWFVWGVVRLRRSIIHEPKLLIYCAPLFSGVLGILVAASSNPYLGKFDYFWIIFLPHFLAGVADRIPNVHRKFRSLSVGA